MASVVKVTYILEYENTIKEVDFRPIPEEKLGRSASIVNKQRTTACIKKQSATVAQISVIKSHLTSFTV